MKRTAITLSLLASLLIVACGGGKAPPADGGPVADGGPPAPPTLGTQIDRMGRPAINTALNKQFSPDATARAAAKDGYNTSSDPTGWIAFAQEFAANLAIIDGLDRNCGNQVLAAPAVDGGIPPDRYLTLAAALTDDKLYVNSTSGTCTTFLAVEANATGLLVNNDCGGRTPGMDVIDIVYSALAAGLGSMVTDGIGADSNPNHSATTFPFLAAP